MYLSTEHETVESVYMVTVKYQDDYVKGGRMYSTLQDVRLYRAATAAMAIAHALVRYAESHDIHVISVSVTTTELVTC